MDRKSYNHPFQSLKPLFCPWCICHFIEAQRNHENISLAPLFVPNSILTWEKKNEFWIPRDRWRGSWSVGDLCISPRLQNQCRNHEGKGSINFLPFEEKNIYLWNSEWIPDKDYGSPSLCFPYETRQPMRCLPRGHSLLEIVEDQLCKQHEFIRKVYNSRLVTIKYGPYYQISHIITAIWFRFGLRAVLDSWKKN